MVPLKYQPDHSNLTVKRKSNRKYASVRFVDTKCMGCRNLSSSQLKNRNLEKEARASKKDTGSVEARDERKR